MISREKLSTINDLKLGDKMDKMSDSQLREYSKALASFIENYPIYENSIKIAFRARDLDKFHSDLNAIGEMLVKIHAEDLAKSCLKLLDDIKVVRNEIAEAYLTYLLTAASMLSIDIQMAEYNTNEEQDKSWMAGAIAQKNNDTKSILAVDDVSLILNGLKTILQGTPYKFTGVTSASAALKYIKDHKPDLFILDVEMPDMNGYELADIIKRNGQTAPIIFLTGNSSREYVVKAIKVGAADFIVKPINKEQVLAKIVKFIE